MSSNSINFGLLSINEKSTFFIQVAPANIDDSSQYTYHAKKQDTNAETLGRVRLVLNSHGGGINFVDPVNIRKVQKELMSQVRTEALHISNKKNSNNQQQSPNLNENRTTPNENRNQYNTGINHRTRMLTTLSPLATHKNRAHGFQHMSQCRPETNTHGGNSHLTSHMYQGMQNRRHAYHTVPFRSSHTYCDQ